MEGEGAPAAALVQEPGEIQQKIHHSEYTISNILDYVRLQLSSYGGRPFSYSGSLRTYNHLTITLPDPCNLSSLYPMPARPHYGEQATYTHTVPYLLVERPSASPYSISTALMMIYPYA